MSSKDINKTRTSEKEVLAAELFESISHPTRIRILKTLAKGDQGFSKLKSKLGFSSSGNLTHHLNKLETEGKLKGAIILMHLGTDRKNDFPFKMLPKLINSLRDKQYRFVTISQLISSSIHI